MKALQGQLIDFYQAFYNPVIKEEMEAFLANQDFFELEINCPQLPEAKLLGTVQFDLLNQVVATGKRFKLTFKASCLSGCREYHAACDYIIEREAENGSIRLDIYIDYPEIIYISRYLDSFFAGSPGHQDREIFIRAEDFDVELLRNLAEIDPIFIECVWPAEADLDAILLACQEELAKAESTNADILAMHQEMQQKLPAKKIAALAEEAVVPTSVEEQVEFLVDKSAGEYYEGNYFGAYSYLMAALRLVEAIKEPADRSLGSLKIHRMLGHLFYSTGLMKIALGSYAKAVGLLEQIGNQAELGPEDMAMLKFDLGNTLYQLGQKTEALSCYDQSVAIFEQHLLTDGQLNSDFADLLDARAQLYEESGDSDLAERDLARCERYSLAEESAMGLFTDPAETFERSPGAPIDLREFPLEPEQPLMKATQQANGQGLELFALAGDKVIYRGLPAVGFDGDRANPETYLKKGEIYTVKTTIMNSSRSYLVLEEVPDKWFNQKYFEDLVN